MDERFSSCAMTNLDYIPPNMDFFYQDIDPVYGKAFKYLYGVVF